MIVAGRTIGKSLSSKGRMFAFPFRRPGTDAEIARLRDKLFRICLAVSDPDLDHVDRCVAVSVIAGSAEDWRP